MQVRPPHFAEQGWYPAESRACQRAIDEYLRSFAGTPSASVAGIVPHAGWVFSGRIAALTFAALRPAAPDLVLLFGGHMRPGERPVCMTSGAFGTPIGEVAVDADFAAALATEFGAEIETPDRFYPDNTIELQLPFVRAIWPDCPVVAVQVAPGAGALEMGRWAADRASGNGRRAVAIGSTDLTHYGRNYGFMPKGAGEQALRWSREENDRPFIDRLLALDAAAAMEHALANHSACCPGAAGAATAFAAARGATGGQLLEHSTSFDVEKRGSPSMWVGYASIVF
ncbi:MAG: AmmeMemoRadiSam system protein B [Deltaproteobacteria bacterium]|nr:AmmeMemoRadiSam system protein B [Deltaproteobacteria bacterium]